MKKTKIVLPCAYLKATSVTAAVLAALYGAPAHADDEGGLSEVTVTATRRVTTSQDIPLSITAVSGAQLQESGIQDISALAHSMAGVNFTDKGPFGGVNGSTLIIRGLNSEATGGQLALASTRRAEGDVQSGGAPGPVRDVGSGRHEGTRIAVRDRPARNK